MSTLFANVIALFNNMRNLKFKSPPMVLFFAAVNQRSGSLGKLKKLRSTMPKGHVLRYDWQISFQSVGFCFSRSFDTGSKGHTLRCDWWISIRFVIFVYLCFSRSDLLGANLQIFKL